MYQEDDSAALKHLDRAVAALDEHTSVSKSDREEEMSRILRARVVRMLRTEDPAGSKALQQLQDLAGPNSNQIVQRSYHAALGAVLLEHRDAKEAIPHLREDVKNAFSLSLLVTAYENLGDKGMAASARKELANLHLPTIDYAVVMAGMRSAAAH